MATYTYDPNVAKQQTELNKMGAGLKVDGFLGPLTQAAITKYSSGPTIQNNALVPQVNAGSISKTSTSGDGFIGPIKPTVISSSSATKDLEKIRGTVTQADADMKAQAERVAQEKLAMEQKATADAQAKLLADQKAEELRIKEMALSEPGAEYKTEKTTAQTLLDKTMADYERESQNVANTIKRIQSGAIPLNSGEQAQVAGLENSYRQLIEEQRLINTGAQGLQNIRGYQTGAGEYDPTFQAKIIGGIVTAGLQKIANLETQMSSAVATLIQGFKDDNISAIKDAWEVYNTATKERTTALTKTIDDANAAIKEENEKLETLRKEQIVVKSDIDAVAGAAAKNFAPPEIIAAINAARTVGEAIAAAGKYIGDEGEVLDREYKRAQIEELKANAARIRAETAADSPQAKAAQAQTELLDNVALVDSILESPYMGQVFGFKNPFTYWTPGSNEQTVKNQVNQVIALLSLENRQKLKGQGAVSDFEGRMLERASSALGKNLDNKSAERELRRIKGAFSTAAGLTATVKITAPNGESRVVEADRNGINQAIIDGLEVEYQ